MPRPPLRTLGAFVLLAGVAGCGEGDLSEEQETAKRKGAGDAVVKSKDGGSGADREKPAPTKDAGAGDRESDPSAGRFHVPGGDNSIVESGVEASSAQRGSAAAALHAYLVARAAHDWAESCSNLSSEIIRELSDLVDEAGGNRPSCKQVLTAFTEGISQAALDEATRADVGAFRVDGGWGFLLYHGAGGTAYAMPMSLEGGKWKVSALEGSALR